MTNKSLTVHTEGRVL